MVVELPSFVKLEEVASLQDYVILRSSRSRVSRSARLPAPVEVRKKSTAGWPHPLSELNSVGRDSHESEDPAALRAEITKRDSTISQLREKIYRLRVRFSYSVAVHFVLVCHSGPGGSPAWTGQYRRTAAEPFGSVDNSESLISAQFDS